MPVSRLCSRSLSTWVDRPTCFLPYAFLCMFHYELWSTARSTALHESALLCYVFNELKISIFLSSPPQFSTSVKSFVMPQSRRYRGVTTTYICSAKKPSYVYAKHQYKHKWEYKSMQCLYIPTIKAQLQNYQRTWYNNIWILHHQEVQRWEYKEIYK